MTEMILTLESAVDNLDVDIRPVVKEIFMSTPNLNNDATISIRKSATATPMRQIQPGPQHMRSTSCNPANFTRRAITSSPPVFDSKSK